MAAGRGDAAAALRGTSPRLPGAGREQTALGTTFGGLLIDEPNSQARRRRPLSRTAGPQALCRRHSRQAAAVLSSPAQEQAPTTRPENGSASGRERERKVGEFTGVAGSVKTK